MGRELESFRPHRLGHGKPDFTGDSSHAGPSPDSFLAPMHRQTRPGVKVWAQIGCAPSAADPTQAQCAWVRCDSGPSKGGSSCHSCMIPRGDRSSILSPSLPRWGGVSGQKHPVPVGPASLPPAVWSPGSGCAEAWSSRLIVN